jgi:hypothetical protein
MLQESEVITFIICSGIMLFIFQFRAKLKRLPSWPILFASFLAFTVATFSANTEHLFTPLIANFFEHFFYSVNALLVLYWCAQVFQIRNR